MKFKIGDKVRIIKGHWNHNHHIPNNRYNGKIGIINRTLFCKSTGYDWWVDIQDDGDFAFSESELVILNQQLLFSFVE